MLLQRLVAAGLLCVSANKAPSRNEKHSIDGVIDEDAAFEIPMIHAPLEAQQVFLTVHDLTMQEESSRHIQEKEELLQRMDRGYGKWDASHPRHRLLDALYGFSKYFDRNVEDLKRWKTLYSRVSRGHKKILESTVQYSNKFSRIEHRLAENHLLCRRIVDNALEFYSVGRAELDEHIRVAEAEKKVAEKVSVSQALKHFARDWSDEGSEERVDAFPCLVKTLDGLFPERMDAEKPVKVLFPGAGLGRLGHEVAALGGFQVTNNEWSMYMSVAYRVLEAYTAPNTGSVYPFVDNWSHHISNTDMMRKVPFPDMHINATATLLVEGDFTKVFRDRPAAFDAIVTHFFIDTARNLMAYLETIHHLLPAGGHWVNFGPLLYGTGPFVQLSLEEIIAVAEAMGFEFLETEDECGELTVEGAKVRGMQAVYGFNGRALTRNAYQAQFWVARKRR